MISTITFQKYFFDGFISTIDENITPIQIKVVQVFAKKVLFLVNDDKFKLDKLLSQISYLKTRSETTL